MGPFDFIKRIFRRTEEEDDFAEMPGTAEFQAQPNVGTSPQMYLTSPTYPAPQNPFANIPESRIENPTPPAQMFNPPLQNTAPINQTFGQSNSEQELIKEKIRVLENKIDVLNAKIDQIIQKLNLLESYFRYR